MHSLSVREISVNKEERKNHYEKTMADLEQEEEFLAGYLVACERNVYMSPFELLFCSYYHDISHALTYSKRRLKEWFEAAKDHEKERIVITTVRFQMNIFYTMIMVMGILLILNSLIWVRLCMIYCHSWRNR